jgi:hypothetical protein
MARSDVFREAAGVLQSAASNIEQPFATILSHSITAWSGPAADRLATSLRTWDEVCSAVAESLGRHARSMIAEASRLETSQVSNGW